MAKGSPKAQTVPFPISSVANGVSQQAPTLRLPNQVEEAINIRSTILGGVGPRTGTSHIAQYAADPAVPLINSLPFQFDRGPDGRYCGIATPAGLRIFNIDTGVESTITYTGDGASWFNTITDPREQLSFVSAGNYLFLADNTRKVKMLSSSTTPGPVSEAFFFIRSLGYDQNYSFTLGMPGITWSAVAGGPAAAGGVAVQLQQNNAAGTLSNWIGGGVMASPAGQGVTNANQGWQQISIVAALGAIGFTVTPYRNLIRVVRLDGQRFTMGVNDASGQGNNISVINNSVKAFTDLPAVGYPGMIVRVSPAANTNQLDYWVQYNETDSTGVATTGYWSEVPGPSTMTTFDPATMPYALKLTSPNNFTFGPVAWDKRKIGNDKTIPPPSFVGQYITGMFFTRGRLGFVMSDGVVTSRSDDNPFTFWRETSTDLLDTDPIDLVNGTEDVVDIHSVALVGQDPVLFSPKRQLGLISPSGTAMTPRTAELVALSAYQTPPSAAPLPYGTTAFFPTPGNKFTGISQFEIDNSNMKPTGSATAVTDHVPAYIPSKLWQFNACSAESLVFIVAGDARNQVFVYEFLDSGQQGRVQSAWAKWAWDKDCVILGFFVNEKMATMLIARGGKVYMEQMDLASDRLVGPNADDLVLDRKHVPPILYDESDKWTFLQPPFPVTKDDLDSWYVVTQDAAGKLIDIFPVSYRSDILSKVNTDLRGKTFTFGRAPRCYLQLSEPVARTPGTTDAIYADVTIKKVGPVFGQSSGLNLRIGYKSRRSYAAMVMTGEAVRWDGLPESTMLNPDKTVPGSGDYLYIFQAQSEDTSPRRFITAAGRANDILIAFENNGPRTFKVVGVVLLVSVTPRFTGR